MKIEDKKQLEDLKKKYGKSFNRIIRVRKNYPFGKKSIKVLTFIKNKYFFRYIIREKCVHTY